MPATLAAPAPGPDPAERDAPTARHHRAPALALAALAALAVAAPLPVLGREAALATFYDDAFYYFQIAREVARGSGFTFDGVHATNGFHPLWLLLLVPLFRLMGEGAALHAALAVQGALVGGAAAIVFHALRPRLSGAAAAAAALLLVGQPSAARILGGGMEGALVLVLLTLVWTRGLRLSETDVSPPRAWLEVGGWCALLFLARLEAIVAVPLLLVLGRHAWRRQPLCAVALAAPTAAAAVAYVTWNRVAFGLWLPVSALVKAHLGPIVWGGLPAAKRVTLALDVPWIGGALAHRLMLAAGADMDWHPAVSMALLVLTIAVLVWKRRPVGQALRQAGAPFVVAFALVLMVVDKIGVRFSHDWYRAPSLLLTSVVAAALLARSPRLSRLAVCALVPVVLFRAGQRLAQAVHPAPPASAVVQAADWVRALPPGARIASWNAGGLGYLADRNVVGLDGLVNDAAFYREVVISGRLAPYLAREHIRWLVDVAFEDGRLGPLRLYEPAERAAVEADYAPRAYLRGGCTGPCAAMAVFERTAP